jgi:hypothetical protein
MGRGPWSLSVGIKQMLQLCYRPIEQTLILGGGNLCANILKKTGGDRRPWELEPFYDICDHILGLDFAVHSILIVSQILTAVEVCS